MRCNNRIMPSPMDWSPVDKSAKKKKQAASKSKSKQPKTDKPVKMDWTPTEKQVKPAKKKTTTAVRTKKRKSDPDWKP